MKNREFTEQLCVLTAKTGIFFAKCDGDYDEREQNFIHSYLNVLNLNGILTSWTKANIENLEFSNLTIQQIVDDTRLLLAHLEAKERIDCVKALKRFIQKVLQADNVIKPEETENFRIWKEQIEEIQN